MARVLVIDDCHGTAEALAHLLAGWGHTARACFCGPAALAAATSLGPQIALVDLAMPGLGGAEVARLLRAGLGLRPWLVALTGLAPSEIPAADAASFDLVLYKPVEPDELRELLRSLEAGVPPAGAGPQARVET
jgi:two-component system, OmpR family, response regulator